MNRGNQLTRSPRNPVRLTSKNAETAYQRTVWLQAARRCNELALAFLLVTATVFLVDVFWGPTPK
jgi:hypothetical protein